MLWGGKRGAGNADAGCSAGKSSLQQRQTLRCMLVKRPLPPHSLLASCLMPGDARSHGGQDEGVGDGTSVSPGLCRSGLAWLRWAEAARPVPGHGQRPSPRSERAAPACPMEWPRFHGLPPSPSACTYFKTVPDRVCLGERLISHVTPTEKFMSKVCSSGAKRRTINDWEEVKICFQTRQNPPPVLPRAKPHCHCSARFLQVLGRENGKMEQAVRRLLAGLFVSGLETLCKERRRGLKPSSDVSVSDSQAVGGGEGNGAEDVGRNMAECLSPQRRQLAGLTGEEVEVDHQRSPPYHHAAQGGERPSTRPWHGHGARHQSHEEATQPPSPRPACSLLGTVWAQQWRGSRGGKPKARVWPGLLNARLSIITE